MEIMQFVKDHPIPVAVGAIGLVAVMVMSGGGNASAASANNVALASQTNQNATNVQLAGIDAQVTAAQTNAAANVQEANIAAATQQAGYTASLAATQQSGLLQTALAMIGYQNNVNTTNANLTASLAQTNAGIWSATMDHSAQMQSLADQTTLGQGQLSLQSQQISAQQAEMPNYLQAMENIAQINSTVGIANANANAALANAKANAITQQSTASSVNSYIGDAASVAGLALAFM